MKLVGLVAAPHTPFNSSGELNLSAVEKQAARLIATQVRGAFIAGTTGEASSLTFAERLKLTERWSEVCKGTDLKLIVHVGHNSVAEGAELARHAEKSGADAIAAFAPSYFKPQNVSQLVSCMAQIAAGAPSLPFYFYDIPPLTGVELSMVQFIEQAASKIPNFVGLKHTNMNLMQLQLCLDLNGGKFDILFGYDENLLAGFVLGAKGAVGSTYNFAAPLYYRIIDAFNAGDISKARAFQLQSSKMISVLAKFGFAGSCKYVMNLVGVDCGPTRLPLPFPNQDAQAAIRDELAKIDFESCIR